MGYYIANRLQEIKEHLGPVLKEMKLKVRAKVRPDSIAIVLKSARLADFKSPISIIFADKEHTGLAEASWKHAHLEIEGWVCRALRDTDWVSWKMGQYTTRALKGEGDELFQWLKFVLDFNGVVPHLVNSDKCFALPEAADAYNEFARYVPVHITQEHEVPYGGTETLHFKDLDGQYVQLECGLVSRKARLIINHKMVDTFAVYDIVRLREWARKLVDHKALSRRGQSFERYPKSNLKQWTEEPGGYRNPIPR